MTVHRRLLTRSWIPIGIAMLMIGQLTVPYVLSHVALSVVVASGAVALIVGKHVAIATMFLRSLHAEFRRRN